MSYRRARRTFGARMFPSLRGRAKGETWRQRQGRLRAAARSDARVAAFRAGMQRYVECMAEVLFDETESPLLRLARKAGRRNARVFSVPIDYGELNDDG